MMMCIKVASGSIGSPKAAASAMVSGTRSAAFSSQTTQHVRSTTASGSTVYESARAVHEYVQFHYAKPEEIFPFGTECAPPGQAMRFLELSVAQTADLVPPNHRQRALDVGCAVGGASFELCKHFDEVVGVDFSHRFVEAANEMKQQGSMPYTTTIQGDIQQSRVAQVPNTVDRSRAHFQQGDACNLDKALGCLDVVFASNLLCRLPEPRRFLDDMQHFVRQDGILALISPYSWLEEYTSKDQWIGAQMDANHPDQSVHSFDELQRILTQDNRFELVHRRQFSFLIREHERKYQFGVSDGTFWRRK